MLLTFTKLIKAYLGLIIFLLVVSSIVTYSQTESVEKILREDGSIITGTNGAYNAEGYTLVTDENNKPKLIKTEELYKSKGSSTVTWSTFGTGVDVDFLETPIVYALAVIGSDLYVGWGFNYCW